jgi:hypothetical protein
MMTLAKK